MRLLTRKARFWIAITVVCAVIIGIGRWIGGESKRVLPDGTTFILSGVQIGNTNGYEHGTRLSKALGGLVPSNGLNLGVFKIGRARTVTMPAYQGGELLTAELWLRPGSPRETSLTQPHFHRKYRLLLSGERDDFSFVNEFNGFRKFDDGLFALIYAYSFPRDAEQIRFRLEERESLTSREWREVVTFLVKNPKPARVARWTPDERPRFRLPNDVEVEVGDLVLRDEPVHPTDIWENTAELLLKFRHNGQLLTNWGALAGKVFDSSGNIDAVRSFKKLTNDWSVYRLFRPLDPTKLWRFELRLGVDSNFSPTNLFSFSVPFPLPGPIQTNLGGNVCQIEFVSQAMLSVDLPNQPSGVRLSFVSAQDDAGRNLDDRSGSWLQHSFRRSLKVRERLSNPRVDKINATIALRPEYEVQFTLRPRDERVRKDKGRQ
jgi:hypothetical protein